MKATASAMHSDEGPVAACEGWRSLEGWSPRAQVFRTKPMGCSDRPGCLSVVRQDDASGELDGRDQNHCAVRQRCVVRVTEAQLPTDVDPASRASSV
jgi:hypothetical protein